MLSFKIKTPGAHTPGLQPNLTDVRTLNITALTLIVETRKDFLSGNLAGLEIALKAVKGDSFPLGVNFLFEYGKVSRSLKFSFFSSCTVLKIILSVVAMKQIAPERKAHFEKCCFCFSPVNLSDEGVTYANGKAAHDACHDANEFEKANAMDRLNFFVQ